MPLSLVGRMDNQLINTKSERWKYENEIRLKYNSQRLLPFKRESLCSVIFGSRSTDKDRYSILKILVCLGYKFETYLSKMQPDKYNMRIDNLILNDIAGSGGYWEKFNFQNSKSK